MCMTCCDLVVKLNNFLKINKKILLILLLFLTVVFSVTVLFKQVDKIATKEEFLMIDSNAKHNEDSRSCYSIHTMWRLKKKVQSEM